MVNVVQYLDPSEACQDGCAEAGLQPAYKGKGRGNVTAQRCTVKRIRKRLSHDDEALVVALRLSLTAPHSVRLFSLRGTQHSMQVC